MEIDAIDADTAYSSKSNIELTKSKDIKLAAPLNPLVEKGNRQNTLNFEYNKDADMYVCPAGHMAVRKAREFRTNDKAHKNDRFRYFFDIDKCKVCPLRNGCYRPGAKSKCFNVTIKTEAQKELLEYQKTPEFAQLQRKRYKIEAKNSELKNTLGYDRALSYGLSCMEMQGALTIFAANVKRILKLMHKA